jgi:hypothetical protein
MDTDTYRCVHKFIVDSGSGAGETPALPGGENHGDALEPEGLGFYLDSP